MNSTPEQPDSVAAVTYPSAQPALEQGAAAPCGWLSPVLRVTARIPPLASALFGFGFGCFAATGVGMACSPSESPSSPYYQPIEASTVMVEHYRALARSPLYSEPESAVWVPTMADVDLIPEGASEDHCTRVFRKAGTDVSRGHWAGCSHSVVDWTWPGDRLVRLYFTDDRLVARTYNGLDIDR